MSVANRITRLNTQARVFVFDFLRKAPSELPEGVAVWTSPDKTMTMYSVDVRDVSQLRVSRNVSNSSPGTFSFTVVNRNDRYFYPDDPESDIKEAACKKSEYGWEGYPYGVPLQGSYARRFLETPNFIGLRPDPDDASKLVLVRRDPRNGAYVYYKDVNGKTRQMALAHDDAVEVAKEARPAWDLYTRYGGVLQKANCIFESMQYISIWLPKRFSNERGDLKCVFTGLINTVTEQWRDGQSTIEITGEDVTKWLRLNRINMNPAAVDVTDETRGGEQFQMYTHCFANMPGWQIIKELVTGSRTTGSSNPTRAVWNFSEIAVRDPNAHLYDPLELYKEGDAFSYNINEHAAGIFQKSSLHLQVVPEDDQTDTLIAAASGGVDYTPALRYTPYKIMQRSNVPIYESEFKDRLSIAWDVAKLTDFVFYADGVGDLWYHQPRYDIAHILCAPNPEVFILRDDAIISWSFSETDSDMVTRLRVFGTSHYLVGLADYKKVAVGMMNVVEDRALARAYGTRERTVEHPYISTAAECAYYGKSLLRRLNADLFQGTVTITGRAEIEPGYPVYVPARNRVYYVVSVDHSYTFGGEFITTLGLSYGRKPWDWLPELLDYDGPERVDTRRQQQGYQAFQRFMKSTSLREGKKSILTSETDPPMWPGDVLNVDESRRFDSTYRASWGWAGIESTSGHTPEELRTALMSYARAFKGEAKGSKYAGALPFPFEAGEVVHYAFGRPEGWLRFATDSTGVIFNDASNATGALSTRIEMDCTTFVSIVYAGFGVVPILSGQWTWARRGRPAIDLLGAGFGATFSSFRTSVIAENQLDTFDKQVVGFYDKYLRPGDILVFGSQETHVGLYEGNGYVIHCSVDAAQRKQDPEDQNGSAIQRTRLDKMTNPVSSAWRIFGGSSNIYGEETSGVPPIGIQYIVPIPWRIMLQDKKR